MTRALLVRWLLVLALGLVAAGGGAPSHAQTSEPALGAGPTGPEYPARPAGALAPGRLLEPTARPRPSGPPPGLPMDLTGVWAFRPGDDPRWADPALDDADWRRLAVPVPWSRQGVEAERGWYRRTIPLAPLRGPDGRIGPLAVTIGDVMGAYELYANGRRIGGRGSLGPEPRIRYGDHETYPVHPHLLNDADDLVLALRVAGRPPPLRTRMAGAYGGPFLLGPPHLLEMLQLRAMMLPLVLSVLYLVVALYHLLLFARVPRLREYLWYGLLTLALCLYTLLASQWKFELELPFALLKKLEHGTLFVLPALVLEVARTLFGVRLPRLLRGAQGACLLFALLVVAVPGVGIHGAVFDPWSLLAVAANTCALAIPVRQALRGNREAYATLAGATVFFATGLHDLLATQGLLATPRLLSVGFAAFALSMAASLAERFTRLYGGLEAAVADRTRQLAEASVRRRRLFADIVHDLGTPLSVVGGYLQSMRRGKLEPSAERLAVMQDELGLIESLVQDLRLLSLADAGELQLVKTVTDPAALLAAVRDAFEPLARERGVALEVRALERPPSAELDPERMKRVLGNLVVNAVRHTAEGGTVQLRAERQNGDLILRVVDTGEGVPADALPHLFERFYRADDSRSGARGGSGLGLAIAKSIVELHGGTISARSAVGVGTTVSIRVPLGQPGKERTLFVDGAGAGAAASLPGRGSRPPGARLPSGGT